VYVWGRDWIQAKTQAECYDYLFEAAVRMAQLGIDASRPPPPLALPAAAGGGGKRGAAENGVHENGAHANVDPTSTSASGSKRPKLLQQQQRGWRPTAIVLDIEGTVAPISYMADVMFPYARTHVASHLASHYDSAETQADIEAIRQQVRRAGAEEVCVCVCVCVSCHSLHVQLACTARVPLWTQPESGAVWRCPPHTQAAADGGAAIPPASAGQAAVVEAVVAWVHAAIAADRKVGALKQLQGHVWRSGFKKGELVAQLFRCVWVLGGQRVAHW
jgi:methylthioribulose 1-phosphate dehydratase/enolase-phosphatase E1